MLDDRLELTDDADFQRILDKALAQLSLPGDVAVVLEGSIAEGFGNRTSDVDFLVITAEDHRSKTLPVVMFIDGCRVEVRLRSAADILRAAAMIGGPCAEVANLAASINKADLDRMQRFLRGRPLRNAALFERLKGQYDLVAFRSVVALWQAQRSQAAANRARLLHDLGRTDIGLDWMRLAVVAAAKSWAAERDETYISDKWLEMQLRRAGAAEDLQAALWSLYGRSVSDADADSFVAEAEMLVSRFGVTLPRQDLDAVHATPREGVTTWQAGNWLTVIRNKQEVLLLGEAAARVWRAIAFWHPLPKVLRATGIDRVTAAHCLELFHRLGLINFAWADGHSWARAGSPDVIVAEGAFVASMGVRGVNVLPAEVAALHVNAQRLSFAGCELTWANTSIENAWEDFAGAYEKGQWRATQAAVQNLVVWACQATFSAHGVNPPPDRQEIASRLVEISCVPEDIVAEVRTLRFVSISNRCEADAARARVQRLLDDLFILRGGDPFPQSFNSAGGWGQTLGHVFDWARLAAFVDDLSQPFGRTFPLEEVRDLMALRQGDSKSAGASTRGGFSIGSWHLSKETRLSAQGLLYE